MLTAKIGAGIALGAAAMVLGASPALAASWTIVSVPPTGQNAQLLGVSAPSDTNAWAVGNENGAINTGLGSHALIDHWNGTAWSQATVPTLTGTVSLAGVSSSGASDAWAVGTQRPQRYTFDPLALHWNGTAWATSPSISSGVPGDTYLVGVADISPTAAYAIGDDTPAASGELTQWNGTAWSKVSYPLPTSTGFPNTLNAISANGPNNVWIVGSYMIQVSPTNLRYETFSDHWNGSAWSVVPMPLVSGSDPLLAYEFGSVDAISPTNVWAVGGSGDNVIGLGGSPSNTLIEHYNGTSWSIVPSPNSGTNNGLTGVTESSPASLWAVGSSIPSGATQAQTLTLNWNGTAWATVASPNQGSPSRLTSVSTTPGVAIIWAAGFSGTTGSFSPLVMQNG
jgi:hypothetical protein